MQYLRSGELLAFFFSRLSTRLADCMAEKGKINANVSLKLYPYLRVAAQSLVHSSVKHEGKLDDGNGAAISGSELVTEYNGESKTKLVNYNTTEDMYASMGVFGAMHPSSSGYGSSCLSVSAILGSATKIKARGSSSPSGDGGLENNDNTASTGSTITQTPRHVDSLLVEGFRPLLEKYLSASYIRMSTPVQQMFPQLEGYTAAVPSKRDVQELMKVLSRELSASVTDGGLSLFKVVCLEANKSVHLILSNVKNMVISPSNDDTLYEISSLLALQKEKEKEKEKAVKVLLMVVAEMGAAPLHFSHAAQIRNTISSF